MMVIIMMVMKKNLIEIWVFREASDEAGEGSALCGLGEV